MPPPAGRRRSGRRRSAVVPGRDAGTATAGLAVGAGLLLGAAGGVLAGLLRAPRRPGAGSAR
jgi:hypothetical protein